jgi:regulator of RNase E activity RraA
MSVSLETIEALRRIDTPTVCNALELIDPARRRHGFNRRPFVCPFPDLPPLVGFARTAEITCSVSTGIKDQRAMRLGYYAYVESGPRPSVVVIADRDKAEPGIGAFWGEVQTNIHKALGCAGVITDGSVRDIPQMAQGFFVLAGSIMPSHVHADIIGFDVPVTVMGLEVRSGDLIHADRHGMVVIPEDAAADVPAAAELLTRREKVILDAGRRGGFSTEDIRAAFAEMDDIH